MRKILLVVLTIMASSLATAGDYYQSKGNGVFACDQKKITAEIADAIEHPGTLSDERFFRLAAEGQCGRLSTLAKIEVIRIETIAVPAGVQKAAYARTNIPGAPTDYFYVMRRHIEKVSGKKVASK
jgi:hypothetical protein